jgi:acetyl esterase/lipase
MQGSIVTGFLVLLLSIPSLSFSQTATPPPQPETGPGGKQATHASVIKNKYGKGSKEYWIYEPDSPKPASAPVVIFLHGWGGTNPFYYGAWIDHLVKRGNVVIYPRYQANILTAREFFIPNSIDGIKAAFNTLQTEPGHVRPDLNRVAIVGHSLGGLMAASVAALASESGLPKIRAVMSVEPGLTRSPASVPIADLKKIPADTLLLAIAGDRDTLVADEDAKRVFYESIQVSLKNKNFIRLVTDDHGRPNLIASHRAPTAPEKAYDNGEGNQMELGQSGGVGGRSGSDGRIPDVNALDYYGLWKLFDGLTDAAFFGKNREYALGNTPQQRFMGKWSDGVPVKELIVTDKP